MISSPSGSPHRTLVETLGTLHEQDAEPTVRPPAHRSTGWGRLPASVRERRSERLAELTRGAVLTRGLGRSYGDAALPPADRSEVAGSSLADRILAFDPATGVLRCEAGLRLGELIRLLLPRCFFPPVVPGTQEVTIGGMVAADIHGKNHHRDGTFGEHVTELLLQLGGGDLVTCSPTRNAELFWATIGGMGLTGHILEVEVRLERVPSPWIHAEREAWTELPGLLAALRAAGAQWPFTAAWVDLACRGRAFGRGLLYRGRWASPEEAPSQPPRPRRPWHLPPSAPSGLIRPSTTRLFNTMVFAAGSWRSPRVEVASPESFFFPLDTIADWHRLYGRRGLTQYQCVLPHAAGPGAVTDLVALLREAPLPVALCVAKDCGAAGRGLLSFPMPGLTLAADLPIGPGLQETIDRLNDLVVAAGGRIYLAKDAFTRARHYRAMEPRLAAWQEIRRRWNGEDAPRSALSVRLHGDPS